MPVPSPDNIPYSINVSADMTIKTSYCLLHPVLFLMMLSAAVCCSAPAGRETFVKQSVRDSGGRYVFSIDLGDSISVHTLEFYTMIDASDRDFDAMPAMIPLRIEAVSPSGEEYSETVGLPRDSYVRKTPFSVQYGSVYREGFVPSEYGMWTLSVKVLGEDSFPGLRGMGLRHSMSGNP